MHIWPDSELLEFVSLFAKKFNWLTGKDNFWLSYQIVIISFINLIVAFYYARLIGDKGKILSGVILTAASFSLIRIMEKVRTELQEVKVLETEIYFLIIRLMLLLGAFTFFLRPIFLPQIITTDKIFIFRGIWVLCNVLAFYFASIDKPPFSRSQAWEWFKNTISFLPLKPIPIHNR